MYLTANLGTLREGRFRKLHNKDLPNLPSSNIAGIIKLKRMRWQVVGSMGQMRNVVEKPHGKGPLEAHTRI
jgi:hypothetical protein